MQFCESKVARFVFWKLGCLKLGVFAFFPHFFRVCIYSCLNVIFLFSSQIKNVFNYCEYFHSWLFLPGEMLFHSGEEINIH